MPDGDILVHAGDLTQGGSFTEMQAQIDWIRQAPSLVLLIIFFTNYSTSIGVAARI